MDQNQEYNPDIVTLSDDDGKEYTFEVLDAIESDMGRYLALLPVYDEPEQQLSEDGELVIVKVEEDRTYLIKRLAAHLKRIDSVGERRFIAVLDNSLYVGTFLGQGDVKGLFVIFNLELVELRGAERCLALGKDCVSLAGCCAVARTACCNTYHKR